MKKTYIITFCISVLSLFSVSIVLLMLMLPQQSQIVQSKVNDYEAIKKTEYTYEKTKELQKEKFIKDYSITTQDIAGFKSSKQYSSGNSDPFAQIATQDSTTTAGQTSTGTTTGTTSATTQKTTNSNGGVQSPATTNK